MTQYVIKGLPPLGNGDSIAFEPGKREYQVPTIEIRPDKPEPPEMEYIAVLPGVVTVSVHGKGCCCKNCPWKGDHG